MSEIPGSGWYLEVENTNTGHVFTPDIIEANRQPSTNTYPRVEITIKKDPKYRDTAFDDAPVRLWKDGARQPIDRLERTEETEDRTILKAKGGIELETRVRRESATELAHKLAEDIVANETSYTANVDTPQTETEQDVTLNTSGTTSELGDLFPTTIDNQTPLEIAGGEIRPLQTSIMKTTDEWTINTQAIINDTDSQYKDEAEGGDAAFFFNARGSPVSSITAPNSGSTTVGVQTQSIDSGSVVLYDSNEARMAKVNADSSTWQDASVGSPVEFVRVVDNCPIVSSETVAVAENSDGSGTVSSTDVSTSEGETVSTSFSFDYDIPGDDFEIYVRQYSTELDPDLKLGVRLDGTLLDRSRGGLDDYGFEKGAFGFSQSELAAGTYNIKLELLDDLESSGSIGIAADAIIAQDERFSYTFPSDVDSNNRLAGPEDYPVAQTIESRDVRSTRRIDVGKLQSNWDDTSNSQQVAISADGGQNYTVADNSSSVSKDFADAAVTDIRCRLRLSRYGSRTTASPTQGYNGQSVSLVELLADVDGTPLVQDRTLDDSAMNVLQELADIGDNIFEFRVEAGTESVEYTQPGQRSADRDEAVTTVEAERIVEERVDKVTVKGSAQRIRGEEITANVGSAVQLDEDEVVIGREAVVDPSTGQQYDANGIDYILNGQPGTIEATASGDISDGQTVEVDYDHKPVGSHTNRTPIRREIVRDIPSAASERAASTAAYQLARQLQDPLQEGRVEIPSSKVGWSVVEAISLDELPIDGRVRIRRIEQSAGSTVLLLGTRQTIDEAVGTIRTRLSAVSKRV